MKRSIYHFAVLLGLTALSVALWAATAPVNDWKIAGPFGGTATTLAIDPKDFEYAVGWGDEFLAV